MTKKNTSSKKKLLPAAGMLALSAAMLSSATFAWFTMSREVEVQNIQMTATVPEDLQISLGQLTSGTLVGEEGYISGAAATVSTVATDWGNTANISHYYTVGKLIPASSTTGLNVYFTPDANDVGKTVKPNAAYYAAVEGATVTAENTLGDNNGGKANVMSELHINTGTTWTETESLKWNNTKSDGYYVDIPVWLRTSSNADTDLSVVAFVKNNTDAKIGDATVELYKAARVAILNADKTSTSKLLPLRDGSYTGTANIVDFYGRNTVTGAEDSSKKGTADAASATNAYGKAEQYTEGTKVVTVPGSSTNEYGAPVQIWLRVWLEGEDPECWNKNAGQDFSISLKFSKIEPASTTTTEP